MRCRRRKACALLVGMRLLRSPVTAWRQAASVLNWLALLACCLPVAVGAQSYPSRPIRMIVPLAVGGTGDTLARVVSEEMSKILGQPFVVENRAGSGGLIGTEAVAKSPADGYTLLFASPAHVINPLLRPNSYDPVKDFEPVSVIANTYMLLLAHPSLPAASVGERVAFWSAARRRNFAD